MSYCIDVSTLGQFEPGAFAFAHIDGAAPMYRQLAEQLRDAIMSGRIRIGDKLPAERALADQLRLSRTTVQSAYRELESLGLLQTRLGSGTFVAARPECSTRTAPSPLRHLFAKRMNGVATTFWRDIMLGVSQDARYSFETGMPDPDLLPQDDFQLVIHDLFSRRLHELMNYAPVEGLPSLRDAIARVLLPMRGLTHIGHDEVLITTGTTQSLDLIGKLFLEPGDSVVVTMPTFPGVIDAFRSNGVRFIGVGVDQHGFCVEQLESILATTRPKLVYVQPILHNPTGGVLSSQRRSQLLRLAQRYGFLIIEDDAYGFFGRGPNAMPLRAEDDGNFVLHLGTFSKFATPGFRVGYIVASRGTLRALASLKQLSDLHTSTISQLLIDGWLSMGKVGAHIQRSRQVYQERLSTALKELRGQSLLKPFCEPESGFYIFCRLPSPLRAAALRARAAEFGIHFMCGDSFSHDGNYSDYLRLCTSRLPPPAIQVGIRRLLNVVEEALATAVPEEQALDVVSA
ncbi:MAG TPA: PLP-dependent aminotransferase family protein [Candidatus Baltobacteraceae bacterium]|nr:PLP-dependent aminotransferase family protein [Candidatus Baltobacteraceae bacterium]